MYIEMDCGPELMTTGVWLVVKNFYISISIEVYEKMIYISYYISKHFPEKFIVSIPCFKFSSIQQDVSFVNYNHSRRWYCVIDSSAAQWVQVSGWVGCPVSSSSNKFPLSSATMFWQTFVDTDDKSYVTPTLCAKWIGLQMCLHLVPGPTWPESSLTEPIALLLPYCLLLCSSSLPLLPGFHYLWLLSTKCKNMDCSLPFIIISCVGAAFWLVRHRWCSPPFFLPPSFSPLLSPCALVLINPLRLFGFQPPPPPLSSAVSLAVSHCLTGAL